MLTVKEFLADVQAEIKDNGRPMQMVKEALVNQELLERKDAVLKVLEKLQNAEREHRKFKPDTEVFDVHGQVIQAGFSKTKLDDIKKNRELIEKLEASVVKALEGDFSKVKELAK